jgi:hypothetical protein
MMVTIDNLLVICLLLKDNSIITTTTVTIGADGAPVAAETEIKTVKTLNKSFSEPALDKHVAAPDRDAGTIFCGFSPD